MAKARTIIIPVLILLAVIPFVVILNSGQTFSPDALEHSTWYARRRLQNEDNGVKDIDWSYFHGYCASGSSSIDAGVRDLLECFALCEGISTCQAFTILETGSCQLHPKCSIRVSDDGYKTYLKPSLRLFGNKIPSQGAIRHGQISEKEVDFEALNKNSALELALDAYEADEAIEPEEIVFEDKVVLDLESNETSTKNPHKMGEDHHLCDFCPPSKPCHEPTVCRHSRCFEGVPLPERTACEISRGGNIFPGTCSKGICLTSQEITEPELTEQGNVDENLKKEFVILLHRRCLVHYAEDFGIDSPDVCQRACANQDRCIAFSYLPSCEDYPTGRCLLFDKATCNMKQRAWTSGILKDVALKTKEI